MVAEANNYVANLDQRKLKLVPGPLTGPVVQLPTPNWVLTLNKVFGLFPVVFTWTDSC